MGLDYKNVLGLAHKHDKSWIKHLKRLKPILKQTTKLKSIVGLYYFIIYFYNSNERFLNKKI